MLTERELDHFLDSFLAIPGEEPASRENSSEAEENLEEYQLPTDGLIIRQIEKDGKVGRPHLVCPCADAADRACFVISVREDLPWEEIYDQQPDRCICGYAALFYGV